MQLVATPHKICTVKAAGIEKVGSMEVDIKHDPRTQKKLVPNGDSWYVTLETNDIYYSAFFDFKNGVYKSNIIDIFVNTRKCNLVLLPKHVNSARTIEFTQKIDK